MGKKFQKFPLHGLQDMSIQKHKKTFFGPAKNRAAALHKLTFV